MKNILIIIVMSVLLSLGLNAFAAGDLTVTGNATVNGVLNVGTGGIKFSDGSTQTTAGGEKPFRGCLVRRTTSQSINNSSPTKILFDYEVYDTDNMHSLVTNTDNIYIPTGTSKIRVAWRVGFLPNATGYRRVSLPDVGSDYESNMTVMAVTSAGIPTVLSSSSGVIPVSGTGSEYVSLWVEQTSGTNLSVGGGTGNGTVWLSVEIVE